MKSLEEYTNYLFNCNAADESFDPDGNAEHFEKSRELFNNYSWEEIYPVWLNYLHNSCPTETEVISFANLFSYYGGDEQLVPDPYDFLGYLFYRVDMDKYWDEASDLFDSVACSILGKHKIVSLWDDPYYSPFRDEKIAAAAEKWKSQEKD